MVNEIDIEGISSLAEINFLPARSVVVSLHLQVRALTQHPPPPSQQIAPGEVSVLFYVGCKEGKVGRNCYFFSVNGIVKVTLDRQRVAIA